MSERPAIIDTIEEMLTHEGATIQSMTTSVVVVFYPGHPSGRSGRALFAPKSNDKIEVAYEKGTTTFRSTSPLAEVSQAWLTKCLDKLK